MPKISKTKSDTVEIITLRLDKDTAMYYRKRAKERGTTLSDFIRQTVVQGMISETALDIEQRMREVLSEMGQNSKGNVVSLPESVLRSIFLTEEILGKILEAKNIQDLYEAQDRAKTRLNKEKDTANG